MSNTNIVQSDINNVLAVREELLQLIRASLALNTQRAYQRALAGFSDFVSENRTEVSDNVLAAYITTLYTQGKSPSTISQVVAAVRWQLRNESKEYDLPVTARTLARYPPRR